MPVKNPRGLHDQPAGPRGRSGPGVEAVGIGGLAAVVVAAGLVQGALADMFREELGTRLTRLPNGSVRLAARRLPTPDPAHQLASRAMALDRPHLSQADPAGRTLVIVPP